MFIEQVTDWNHDSTEILEENWPLIKLKFPVLELSQCLMNAPDFFKGYYTNNKYCARYTNGICISYFTR